MLLEMNEIETRRRMNVSVRIEIYRERETKGEFKKEETRTVKCQNERK